MKKRNIRKKRGVSLFSILLFLVIIVALLVGASKVSYNSNSKSGVLKEAYGPITDNTIEIPIQTTFIGNGLVGEDFDFILKKTSGEQVATATNDSDGNVTFEVTFEESDIKNNKYLIYSVQEVQGSNNKVTYDNNKGYVVVELSNDGTNYSIEKISYAKANYIEKDYSKFESQVYHATAEELEGQAYAVYNEKEKSLTFFRDEPGKYQNNSYYYDKDSKYLYFYTDFEDGESTPYNSFKNNINYVIFKDAIKPEKMDLSGFNNCIYFDLEKLDTSRITSMEDMFNGCTSIKNLNVSTFDTSNVENMSGMFRHCQNLNTVILGDFNTANVKNTQNMFADTAITQIDYSTFETDSLTNADEMFCGIETLSIFDLSTWGSNMQYSTSTILGNGGAEYIDISNFKKDYSAEIGANAKLKIVKMDNYTPYRSTLFDIPLINVDTGEIIIRRELDEDVPLTGTFVSMADTTMTFNNYFSPQLSVYKYDEDKEYLEGAKLALLKDDNIVYTWTTNDDCYLLTNLELNSYYTIKELSAPNGYKIDNDVDFNIDASGNIYDNNGKDLREVEIIDELNRIEVEKFWDDRGSEENRPESITLNLYDEVYTNYQKGDDKLGERYLVDTITITDDDDWLGSFENLPVYTNDGLECKYVVEEEEIPNYEVSYDVYDAYVEITNTYSDQGIELTKITVNKTWDDYHNQDGKRPDTVTVNLLADGNKIRTAEVKKADNWTYTFNDIPKYNTNGTEVVYTITEDSVTDYTTQINGYQVINTHIPETISINGTKTWDDSDNQDGKRPESVTINLLADGEKIDSKTITKEDNWSYEFTDLDKYQNQGELINYIITEDAVPEYESVIEGYNVKNTYTPEQIEVSGAKLWDDKDDQDGKRPDSVKVNLLADGEKIDSKEVNAETDWLYKFSNLPKYKAEGEEIIYTVTEDKVDNYETTIDGYNITNKYVPETIVVSGIKTWEDENDKDKIRPEFITVNLLVDGEKISTIKVSSESDWKYSFDNLSKYQNHGKEVVYTITEDEVDGYETKINGYNIKNIHEVKKDTSSSEDKKEEENKTVEKQNTENKTVETTENKAVDNQVKTETADSNQKESIITKIKTVKTSDGIIKMILILISSLVIIVVVSKKQKNKK